MFTKILIANRGEIACRVAATARKLGIQTVAVYSDADAKAKHVAVCDEAYRLGPAPAKESYLRGDAIIEIAKATGAQAIHPGYGFLSENEGFAKACQQAGLIFIGPPASAIAAMGSKSAAKALMEKANVPLVPGYHGDNQDPNYLRAQADATGYPVLIKASAGGGGKGMRTVEQSSDFLSALASCKRESMNAFGNDDVLIERYVTKPRHIEIQVFADQQGNCVYLHERDCSVQRRHQKVVEEAPAPGMTESRRRAMGEAACAAAKAVGYVGAGTVEFIAAPNGEFYFMEMNTRLQVEHPVTEMITGFDLVHWQLSVASGESLPAKQSELVIYGHAIEARIYAENPEKGFLPSIGTLSHLRMPSAIQFIVGHNPQSRIEQRPIVRIDSGVRAGDTISAYYDPMIAKLIVWGADRSQAIQAMSDALQSFEAIGPSTNINFLRRLMSCQSFFHGDLDTALIEREKAHLLPTGSLVTQHDATLAIAALLAKESRLADSDPFSLRDGWRSLVSAEREIFLASEDTIFKASVIYKPSSLEIKFASSTHPATQLSHLEFISVQDGHYVKGVLNNYQAFNIAVGFATSKEGNSQVVLFDKHHSQWNFMPLSQAYAKAQAQEAQGAAKVLSPMPGKIIALQVKVNDVVTKGQALLVLEAMKMEHSVVATKAGKVMMLGGGVGAQMAEGSVLVELGD
jgi:3-methylcrotonyl-CoA carboxylase alpha subunit